MRTWYNKHLIVYSMRK